MKIKALKNLSANTLQLVINQFFAAITFYILSLGLDKAAFGRINLALAILLSVFSILSFGIDQLTVKKVAQGHDVPNVMNLYIGHVLLSGLIFYGLLLLGYIIFHASPNYNLVLWMGFGKLMMFFAMPFKQVTNGLEKFSLLAKMAIISNTLRALGLLALMLCHALNLTTAVITFIAGDTIEFIGNAILFYRHTNYPLRFTFNGIAYRELVKEAMPQLGVVLITAALGRFDWIFIGFMTSDVKLAEYSFAYKVFEVSTLPLMAIGPLLVPLFTRHFINKADNSVLKLLIRGELVIAALTALLLNLTWEPVVNRLTHGKYGTVNIPVVFVLSLCMPLLYLNNFLWTIQFAKGNLKLILNAFVLTLTINIGANLVLIPLYGNIGAAIAFLAATLAQTIFYLYKNPVTELKLVYINALLCTICALVAGFAGRMLHVNILVEIIVSVIIYLVLLFVTMQLRVTDVRQVKKLFQS
jgi:O-antigen/teichoic acid export membrane protein